MCVEIEPKRQPCDATEHIWCCNPKFALCGQDLSAFEDSADDGTDVDCALCEHLWTTDVRCGALFCRLRQRLRGDR